MIAELTDVALILGVFSHVTFKGSFLQIVSTNVASNSLGRLFSVDHSHVNFKSRHSSRTNVANHETIVSWIVAIFEVIQEHDQVLEGFMADVTFVLPFIVHKVSSHVSLERVFIAEEFPAIDAHHRLLNLNVELPSMISQNRFRSKFFVALLASIDGRPIVIFNVIQEHRAFCEFFAAADEISGLTRMELTEMFADVDKFVKFLAADVTFHVDEIFYLLIAFEIVAWVRSAIFVGRRVELVIFDWGFR